MAKVSKGVADKALVTRTVVTATESKSEEIAALVEPLIFIERPPEPLTLAELLAAMGSGLARIQTRLEQLDDGVAEELDEDVAARSERDGAESALRAALVPARSGALAAYGGAGLVQLGLGEAVPPNPEMLLRYADSAADRIERVEIEPVSSAITVDRAALATFIRAAANRLRTALDSHKGESRETESARAARDAEAALWARVYSGFADVITGLAVAAGRSDIADRVRPTARRRAGLPEDTDLQPDPLAPPTDPVES